MCRRPPTRFRWKPTCAPDVAETPLTQEEALAGGPKTEAGMFVAPRILGSEE